MHGSIDCITIADVPPEHEHVFKALTEWGPGWGWQWPKEFAKIKLEWCARCVRSAYNVRSNSEARNESAQDAKERVRPQVSRMGLALTNYWK